MFRTLYRPVAAIGALLGALAVLLVPPAQAGPAAVPAAASADQRPTVRLWATRQGMVGGRTANGHIVTERDRFVALPSRRALSRDDGSEFQVRLRYNGREATAPVWDVGPWNTRDNFWDPPAEREAFKDLPRFVPQTLAAWRDNYNGGRDATGRWVTYPNAIDIADGTFWDDLGMQSSDWVDVTFLWVNAPSPDPTPSPKVTAKRAPATQSAPPAQPDPPSGQRWYIAEGSTKAPFQTWVLLQNPNAQPAQASVTYMLADGSTRSQSLTLKPTSRQSIFTNLGLPDAEFSVRVEADRPIVVERAVYVRGDGHVSAGALKAEPRWCFADGVTGSGDDTWVLVQNPGNEPARATLTLFLAGGGTKQQTLNLPATSRQSVLANLMAPNARFAGCVEADKPIVVEKSAYARGGAAGGLAQPILSPRWYFAEGNTRPGMETRLALGNPGGEPASAQITYLLEDGQPRQRTVQVPAASQVTVNAAEDAPGARFGIVVEASRSIVAERTTSFGVNGAGSHASAGAPDLARTWLFAEGSTGAPFQEFILLANPGSAPASVTVELMREDGSSVSRKVDLGPASRATLDANAAVPNAAISVRVRSTQPIVAERTMYWNNQTGGTSTTGVPLDR